MSVTSLIPETQHWKEAMSACNRADREFVPLRGEGKARKLKRIKQYMESMKPPDSEELKQYPIIREARTRHIRTSDSDAQAN